MPALIVAAAGCNAKNVAAVSRLRQQYDADDVAVALQLAEARRKAERKFPNKLDTLIADGQGVEQASSLAVAGYKASRFADAGVKQVADLCCGIGGDAMGMAAADLQVTGVDLDEVRAWMTKQNAGCEAVVGDVNQTPILAEAMHLDPARRTSSGRVFRLEDYQPGMEAIAQLIGQHETSAVKLSPAVGLRELEDALPLSSDGQIEFISEAGRLVQAVLWHGKAADSQRRATLLYKDAVHRLAGEPTQPGELRLASEGRYLFTVDSAVERAELMHLLELPALHPKLGLLTSEQAVDSPWLTGFELMERMPYRPRKLKKWLSQNDGGLVEVKTRGGAVDTDQAQAELRGKGSTTHTVFVMRRDTQRLAWVTRRVSS